GHGPPFASLALRPGAGGSTGGGRRRPFRRFGFTVARPGITAAPGRRAVRPPVGRGRNDDRHRHAVGRGDLPDAGPAGPGGGGQHHGRHPATGGLTWRRRPPAVSQAWSAGSTPTRSSSS